MSIYKLPKSIDPDGLYYVHKTSNGMSINYRNNMSPIFDHIFNNVKDLKKFIDEHIPSGIENIVVITVPHALPMQHKPRYPDHPFDTISLEIAKEIKSHFNNMYKNVYVKIFSNAQPRIDYDENRPEETKKESQMRKDFKEYIKKWKDNIRIVLDIHSFDVGPKENPNIPFYILDNDADDQKNEHYIKTLLFTKRMEKKTELSIPIYLGSPINFIMEYSRKKNINSFLLESNEKMLKDIGKYIPFIVESIYEIYIGNIIVAPTFGTIVNISRNDDEMVSDKNTKMTIYIAPTDNHKVFAPLDGKIIMIKTVKGSFVVKTFKSKEEHTGRIYLYLENVVLALEVGKPQYITDTVKLDVAKGDYVLKGKEIGEIIIGSTAYIFYNSNEYKPIASKNQKIIGGISEILNKI